MIKNIFFKIGLGVKYVFFDHVDRIYLVLLPNLLFGILGATIVIFNFKNLKEDTTNLTNYGFAILIGIASVCFSWARNLDKEKEPIMLEKISNCGEGFLHCAIIFLLASAMKYSIIHLNILISDTWKIAYNSIYSILTFIYIMSFTLAFYKVEKVICGINILLYKRLYKGERN